MTRISDLSFDLVEEILSRAPLTSLGAVRSTCKPWKELCEDQSFIKKHCGKGPKEFLVNMTLNDYGWDSSTRTIFSLHDINNIKHLPSIKETCRTIFPLQMVQIYPCDGLLLCVALKRKSRLALVVWNPYTSQTRLIKTKNVLDGAYSYAIGYDNNNHHKVLRFFHKLSEVVKPEIYDFKTNSWRALDISSEYCLSRSCHQGGVSLKGNTYYVETESSAIEYVICFDFTAERFGPRLPLPFHSDNKVVSSCVRREQLAVLGQKHLINTDELEIWITTKIEPDAISWSKFFKFDLEQEPHVYSYLLPIYRVRSFFLDEEKNVAVVHGKRDYRWYTTSYVVGEDGYYKKILDLKEYVFSYVPSAAFIQ